MTSRKRFPDWLLLALVCLLFVTMGWPFIARMGIEVDEALAASGLYPNVLPHYSVRVGAWDVPVMLLSYVGALKVWITGPVLSYWGAGPVVLRLPALFIASVTIALFWVLVRRVSGKTAAWIAAPLFATDTTYFLLSCIDFGPVVMQIFLKVAALLLVVHWNSTGKARFLAGACFLFGLALWDKAVFVWPAAGLLIAAVVVWPGKWKRALIPRTAALGLLAFCAGAAPFLLYNVVRPLDTFRSNARVAADEVLPKLGPLRGAVTGEALFGLFTAADIPPAPRQAGDVIQALGEKGALPTRNWMMWVVAAAVLAFPFVWQSSGRAVALFAAIAFAVGWFAMAGSAGAGVAAHHVVLLWPMHYLFIAIVLTEALQDRSRLLLIAAVGFVLAGNLLVTGRYYYEITRNGPGVRWTAAINDLALQLKGSDHVMIADWGIYESLNLLSAGKLPILFANEYTSSTTPPERFAALRDLMKESGTVFVTHAPPYEQLPGVNEALASFARSAECVERVRRPISDKFGRPVFLILQFDCPERQSLYPATMPSSRQTIPR